MKEPLKRIPGDERFKPGPIGVHGQTVERYATAPAELREMVATARAGQSLEPYIAAGVAHFGPRSRKLWVQVAHFAQQVAVLPDEQAEEILDTAIPVIDGAGDAYFRAVFGPDRGDA